MFQQLGRLTYRSSVVMFFTAWACSTSGGSGCGGCGGTSFVYPVNTPGKVPVADAAQVRINQAALDWLNGHMGELFDGVCCPTDPASSVSPAEQCWGKAACFSDLIPGTSTKRLNFYVGSPGAPVDISSGIHVRNGDALPEIDTQYPNAPQTATSLTTGNNAARPYCNDMGGDVCRHQQTPALLANFCRPSSTAGCKNGSELVTNPPDPTQRDYCCGDLAHHDSAGPLGGGPTRQLDICSGDRTPGRCSGYPSSVGIKEDDLKNLHLTILPATANLPAGVQLTLSNFSVGASLDIAADSLLGASFTCMVNDNPTAPIIQGAGLTMEIRPEFVTLASGQPEQLQLCTDCVKVDSFTIPTLGSLNVSKDGADPLCQDEYWEDGWIYTAADFECTTFCTVGNAGGDLITTVFNGVSGLAGFLQGPISSALASAIAGGLNGIPVEVQTQLDLRQTLASAINLRFGKPLGVLAQAHGNGLLVSGTGAAQGLVAGIDVGTESDHEVCVPSLPAPVVPQTVDPQLPPTVTVIDNTQTPPAPRVDTYHVAAALAQPALQRVFYNLFNSGLLCVGIGSDDISKLSGGTQTITAGLLFLLAPELQQFADADAPIFVQLEPQEIPTVRLGSGKATGQLDANGKAIVDSLIQVDLSKLGLSFYVFAQDRYIRIFTVDADLALGLSILRGADNGLELSVDSVATNNVNDTFNALSPTDYSSVVKVILNLVSSTLLSNQLTFSLNFDSTIQGVLGPNVYMRINDVQRAGISNDYLAAFLTMCAVGDPTNAPVCNDGGAPARDVAAPVLSDALPLYVPPQHPLPAAVRATMVPAGALALHVENGEAPREWAVKVDAGVYQSLQRANDKGDIIVDSPNLLMLGKHRLQVISQVAGHYETLSTRPQEVDVELDSERPLAAVERSGDGLRLAATDLVSAPEEIKLELRTVGAGGQSAWRAASQGEVITGAALHDVYSVEARATDHVGNVSDIASFAWAQPPAVVHAQGCGCHSTDGADFGLMFAAVALFLFRRRASGRWLHLR